MLANSLFFLPVSVDIQEKQSAFHIHIFYKQLYVSNSICSYIKYI